MKADRDVAINIAEKAVGGYASVAEAIKERNHLDTLRLRALKGGETDPEEDPEKDPNLPPAPAPTPRRARRSARQAT
jgi:hypothetical protein